MLLGFIHAEELNGPQDRPALGPRSRPCSEERQGPCRATGTVVGLPQPHPCKGSHGPSHMKVLRVGVRPNADPLLRGSDLALRDEPVSREAVRQRGIPHHGG